MKEFTTYKKNELKKLLIEIDENATMIGNLITETDISLSDESAKNIIVIKNIVASFLNEIETISVKRVEFAKPIKVGKPISHTEQIRRRFS